MHATSNAASGAYIPSLGVTLDDPWFTFKVMSVWAVLIIIGTRGRLAYRPSAAPSVTAVPVVPPLA